MSTGTGSTGFTGFPGRVRAVLAALRAGDVVSYGEVAARAGHPGAHRAVGSLLAAGGLPNWWRVVRADGTLACNERGEQERRLASEGVMVTGGRVRGRNLHAILVDLPPTRRR